MLIILHNWSLWHYYELLLMSRVFTNGPGDRGSIPCQVIPKTQKWYLMLPCLTLSILRYRSRIKWNNPRNEVMPSPVVAIEKETSGLPSTVVTNFTYEERFSFLFLTIFMLSHVISSQFIAWSIHTVVFFFQLNIKSFNLSHILVKNECQPILFVFYKKE